MSELPLWIGLGFLGIAAVLLIRNEMVYKFRTTLLRSFNPGDADYWDRNREYERVTYGQMLYSLRSLRSWYAGTEILRRIEGQK